MQSRLLIISICPTKILFFNYYSIIIVLMCEKKPGCVVCVERLLARVCNC